MKNKRKCMKNKWTMSLNKNKIKSNNLKFKWHRNKSGIVLN